MHGATGEIISAQVPGRRQLRRTEIDMSQERSLHLGIHQVSATHLYQGELPPPIDSLDWLIVVGGPMGVHDEADYPWLAAEKRFIDQTIAAGKKVRGV